MEDGWFFNWKSSFQQPVNAETTDDDEPIQPPSFLSIPQPEMPKESIEFLSRSWSPSANEISKVLAEKQKQLLLDKNPNLIPETLITPQLPCSGKGSNYVSSRRSGSISRWFHNRDFSHSSINKRKDKTRIANARVHAALSVSGLAAALAAITAAESSKGPGSTMSTALASATELLAVYCSEMAESAGADHDRVASVVRSAVNISPSELVTLTAAAATALRGDAALRARLSKEAKKNAAISPYDKGLAEASSDSGLLDKLEEEDLPCTGDLLQCSGNGVLRWKHVSVYLNTKSQVIIKLKSKHVGGAFSKKSKCVVYGVCDEATAWPFRKERENMEVFFGIKTAQGLLEFKCRNKIHRQRWVDGIKKLLSQTSDIDSADMSLRLLNINKIL